MPKYASSPADLEAEIRALPMTLEPLPSPREGEMSAADMRLSEELLFRGQEGDPAAIGKLQRLIKKYPEIPSLRNHLTVAYTMAGREELAAEVNEQLRHDFPQYLFGCINFASRFVLKGGDWERVPEALGESLELAALQPGVECFHFSEVRAFYQIVGLFHLRAENLKGAEAIYATLKDLIGSDDPQIMRLGVEIKRQQLESIVERRDADRGKAIHPDFPPLPEFSGSAAAPELHHQEVEALYVYDLTLPLEKLRQILALQPVSLVRDLEAVVRDAIRRGRFFLDGVGVAEDERWFARHAIFFLGELRAVESLPLVFDLLAQHPDILELWFGEYFDDALWEPLFHLIDGQLDLAQDFMLRPAVHYQSKLAVIEAVAQIGVRAPEQREAVVGWIGRVLEFLVDSPPEDNVLDTDVITRLIWVVADYRITELEPVIRKAYELDYPSQTVVGDLDEVLESLEEAGDAGLKPRELLRLSRRYEELIAGGALESSEERARSLPVVPDPKVGRNDPCPCGSGKKYKKCCL